MFTAMRRSPQCIRAAAFAANPVDLTLSRGWPTGSQLGLPSKRKLKEKNNKLNALQINSRKPYDFFKTKKLNLEFLLLVLLVNVLLHKCKKNYEHRLVIKQFFL